MKPYNKPDFDLIEFNVTDICNPSGLEPIPGYPIDDFYCEEDGGMLVYISEDGTFMFHDANNDGMYDPSDGDFRCTLYP